MKNLNFKNFNYTLIDSAKAGYKEVLVTYSANGSAARQCIFVKEAKGKKDSYYLNEAKTQIDAKIKSGELIKATNKQIKSRKHGSAKKPILIAVSSAVAVGAITGAVFIGRELGGGGSSPLVGGHTVVLNAGEFEGTTGKFSSDLPYLIINNVPEGTVLGEIEGYAQPKCGDYDFDGWTSSIPGPYSEKSFKITSDIALTASYSQGIQYTKAAATASINGSLTLILEDESLSDEVKSAAKIMSEDAIKAINDASIDGAESKDLVSEVANFTNQTMDLIKTSKQVKEITKIYQEDIVNIVNARSVPHALALSKTYIAYLKGLEPALKFAPSMLDEAWEVVDKILSDKTTTDDELRAWSRIGSGLILGSAYISESSSSPFDDLYNRARKSFVNIEKFKEQGLIVENDAETLDWVGSYFDNQLAALGKINQAKEKSYLKNILTNPEGVNNGLDCTSLISGYLTNSRDDLLCRINMSTSIINYLVNVDVQTIDEIGGGFSASIMPALNSAKNTITSLYQQMIELPTGVSASDLYTKYANCFINLMEAITINLQNNSLYYLFRDSNDANRGLLDQLALLINRQPQLAKFVDIFDCAAKAAVEIAKMNESEIKNEITTYENLSTLVYDCMQAVYNCAPSLYTTYDYLIAVLKEMISLLPGSNNFVYDRFPSDKPIISGLVSQFTIENLGKSGANVAKTCSDLYIAIIDNTMKFNAQEDVDPYDAGGYLRSLLSSISSGEVSNAFNNNLSGATAMYGLIKLAISDYAYEIYENLRGYLPVEKEDPELFPGIIQNVILAIISGSNIILGNDRRAVTTTRVNLYVNTIKEFFDKLPLLKRNTIEETSALILPALEFFGYEYQERPEPGNLSSEENIIGEDTIIGYFMSALPLGEQLKAAIEENFLNVISESTTAVVLRKSIAATMEACREIIGDK